MLLELLPALHKCLEAMVNESAYPDLGIDWSWDGETITEANGFLFQLESPIFLVSFQILIQFFQILRVVTVNLQRKPSDVVCAYKMVKEVVTTLKSIRTNSAVEFKKHFSEATKLGKCLHGDEFEITTPRLSCRQAHRSNHPSTTLEEYYRVSLYNEFLSHVLAELEERFLNNSNEIAIGLLHLVPSECIQSDVQNEIPHQLTDAVQMFSDDLPHSVMFSTEYSSWVREW